MVERVGQDPLVVLLGVGARAPLVGKVLVSVPLLISSLRAPPGSP